MGDKVRIKVVAANLEKRQLDYEWVLTPAVEETTTEQKGPKNKRKRKNNA